MNPAKLEGKFWNDPDAVNKQDKLDHWRNF